MKKTFLLIVVIVSITLIFSLIPIGFLSADPATYTVSGYVKDPGGNPYSGATISCYDVDHANGAPLISTISDINGYYELNVPSGNLWFVCDNNFPYYVQLFLQPGGTSIPWYKVYNGDYGGPYGTPESCKFTISSNLSNQNFNFTSRGYTIAGNVYDYDTHEEMSWGIILPENYFKVFIDDGSGTYSVKREWVNRWSRWFFPENSKIKLFHTAQGYYSSYYNDKTSYETADEFILDSDKEISIYLHKQLLSSKPFTPGEQVLLNLTIGQQADLYGKNTTGFIKTLYDNILGRVSDDSGLEDWVTALNDGTMTPNQIVFNLVFSDELRPKISSMGPEEFVTFLYENVFNRNPDSGGYDNWVNNIKNGMSKEDALNNFLNCYEFQDICKMFGLNTNEEIRGDDITQVIYLNDQKGAQGFGHAAIILVKSNSGGIYYSFDTEAPITEVLNPINYLAGKIDREFLEPNEMNNFRLGGSGYLDSRKEPYTRYITLNVDKEFGNIMLKIAESKYNSGPELYNLYFHNCNQFVQQILNAGKISFDPIGVLPNDAYNTGVSQWSSYSGFDSGSYY